MCPLCWATALASFGGLVVVAVLSTAGSDRLTFAMAALLGAVSVLEKTGLLAIPWWCFVLLIAALAARICYLLALAREHLLAYKIWNRACQLAAARCPRKQASEPVRSVEA